MKLASKKTEKSIVNSLSSLEGAAIMNNTFCLGVFLFCILFKDMTSDGLMWQFSAETISILLIEIMMGAMVLIKKTHTLMDGFIIFSFYPFALCFVAILESPLIGLD